MHIKRFMSKKVVAIGLAAGVTLGLGGAAFAYFTSTGTGSGSGSVGTATNWGVSTGTTGGAMYPGDASTDQTVAVTITNNATSGYQAIDSYTISVGTDNSGVEGTWTATNSAAVAASASANEETTCSAADFALGGQATAGAYTVTLATPMDLAAQASHTFNVNLHMLDTGVAQDACQGESPALFVSVN